MNKAKIKHLLNFKNKIQLIGANKLELKYTTDYDYQVKHIIDPKDINIKKEILKHFQNIFKVASETDKFHITEFKSGMFKGKITWNHDEIMQGYKEIPGTDMKTLLINNLDNCKIDIVAFTGKIYEEFSCNYYFFERTTKDTENALLLDIKQYYHENKYMKMLKRVMSYRRVNNLPIDDLVNFFNSEAGKLYQEKHRLETLKSINIDIDEDKLNKLIEQTNDMATDFINS